MKRELSYILFIGAAVNTERTIITDERQEKIWLRQLENIAIERNLDIHDKNQIFIQRWENGKRVKQFSWGKPQQERLFQ